DDAERLAALARPQAFVVTALLGVAVMIDDAFLLQHERARHRRGDEPGNADAADHVAERLGLLARWRGRRRGGAGVGRGGFGDAWLPRFDLELADLALADHKLEGFVDPAGGADDHDMRARIDR